MFPICSSWPKDINTCILESYPECSNPRLFYIIPYFCGQHPQCRWPLFMLLMWFISSIFIQAPKQWFKNKRFVNVSKLHLKASMTISRCPWVLSNLWCNHLSWTREPGLWALETAKQNVLDHYLLVGVLEELEDVLLLLERLLPHFFCDVLNIYKSPGETSFRFEEMMFRWIVGNKAGCFFSALSFQDKFI